MFTFGSTRGIRRETTMRGEIFGRVMAPLAAVAAAIFVFGVGLSVAQAEDAKPADTKPATTTPPAVTPAKPADAKPAATTTPATPKTTDTKTAVAAPSPCKNLDETACGANSACSWHKEGKSKKGTAIKAHCQKKPTPTKKKKAGAT
jgi:hypothetical protein